MSTLINFQFLQRSSVINLSTCIKANKTCWKFVIIDNCMICNLYYCSWNDQIIFTTDMKEPVTNENTPNIKINDILPLFNNTHIFIWIFWKKSFSVLREAVSLYLTEWFTPETHHWQCSIVLGVSRREQYLESSSPFPYLGTK